MRNPLLISILTLALIGCAQVPSKFRYHPAQELTEEVSSQLVWPSPPDNPRFRYLGQLTGEDNFFSPGEATANAGIRFLKWIVGLAGHTENPVLLQRPQAVMVAPDGRIFVSDVSRQAVYVFNKQDASLSVWEFAGEELRFVLPIGMALTAQNELLVADASLGAVYRLDSSGKPLGVWAGDEVSHPTGLAINPETDFVYVADRAANQIKVFDAEGALQFTIGEFGEELGLLNGPTYLSWADNKLYVTDTLNSRIQIFRPKVSLSPVLGEEVST